MITGDNLQTGIQIGYRCSIVQEKQKIILIEKGQNSLITIKAKEKKDVEIDNEEELKAYFSTQTDPSCYLAVSGNILEWIFNQSTPLICFILSRTLIYGRTSPMQKQQIVTALKKYNSNLTTFNLDDQPKQQLSIVMMVGDGANDCQALKASDVGLSLNREEASLAADFTSLSIDNISAVIHIIQQGKACLSTSMGCFVFMSFYAIIQFSSVCICHRFYQDLPEMQYYYIDIFLLAFLIFSMNSTQAET